MLMKYIRLAIIAVMAILMATQLLDSASAQEEKVVVTDFTLSPAQENSRQLPKGWALKVWHGKADVRLIWDHNAGMGKCFECEAKKRPFPFTGK